MVQDLITEINRKEAKLKKLEAGDVASQFWQPDEEVFTSLKKFDAKLRWNSGELPDPLTFVTMGMILVVGAPVIFPLMIATYVLCFCADVAKAGSKVAGRALDAAWTEGGLEKKKDKLREDLGGLHAEHRARIRSHLEISGTLADLDKDLGHVPERAQALREEFTAKVQALKETAAQLKRRGLDSVERQTDLYEIAELTRGNVHPEILDDLRLVDRFNRQLEELRLHEERLDYESSVILETESLLAEKSDPLEEEIAKAGGSRATHPGPRYGL